MLAGEFRFFAIGDQEYRVKLIRDFDEFVAFRGQSETRIEDPALLSELHALSAATLFVESQFSGSSQILFDARDRSQAAIDQLKITSDIEADVDVYTTLASAVSTAYVTGSSLQFYKELLKGSASVGVDYLQALLFFGALDAVFERGNGAAISAYGKLLEVTRGDPDQVFGENFIRAMTDETMQSIGEFAALGEIIRASPKLEGSFLGDVISFAVSFFSAPLASIFGPAEKLVELFFDGKWAFETTLKAGDAFQAALLRLRTDVESQEFPGFSTQAMASSLAFFESKYPDFGETPTYQPATEFRHPLGDGTITAANDGDGYYVAQGFNVPNPSLNGSFHLGVDWNGEGGGDTDLGEIVRAIANGRVIAVVADQGASTTHFGNYVVVQHDLPSPTLVNGVPVDRVNSLYAHLNSVEALSVGDPIAIGQQLGTLGKSGYADIAHLHFEMTTGSTLPTSDDGYNPAGAPAAWIDPVAFIVGDRKTGGASVELSMLSVSQGFRIDGQRTGDELGYINAVASAGDVNGDGFGDLIVSAYGADNNARTGSGSSYVVFGKADGFGNIDLASLQSGQGFRIDGARAGDNTGSVGTAGDVNGDGIDDLILGATFATNNGFRSGSAYVLFGRQTGLENVDLASLPLSRGFRIDGQQADDWAGQSVSGAGDVDGDGINDFIIGAPRADNNGRATSGSAYVIYGKDEGNTNVNLASLTSDQGFRIDGGPGRSREGFGAHAGYSVASAGDVNADGYDDVLVGAAYDVQQPQQGAAFLLFGNARGALSNVDLAIGSLTPERGIRFDYSAGGGLGGFGVAGAGDINGDGFADIVLSSPIADNNGRTDSGSVFVLFGKASGWRNLDLANLTAADGFRIDGVRAFDSLGGPASRAAGDVNGDGIDDLVFSSESIDANGRTDSGATYVLYGRRSGLTNIDLAAATNDQGFVDPSQGFRIDGAAAGDSAGISAAGAGDFDGDGFDDVVVGARYADNNGRTNSGSTYVVFGGPTGPGAPTAGWTITPPQPQITEAEGATITFTVTRPASEAVDPDVVFVSTTKPPGSINHNDYDAKLNERLEFAAGERSKTVIVTIRDDNHVEKDETFGLIVQANATDAPSTFLDGTTFTIRDDEVAAPIKLPFRSDKAYAITQGFDTTLSHKNQLKWSVDFGMPNGSDVFSVGSGKIVAFRQSVDDQPLRTPGSGHGNYVTIKLDDGDVYVTYGHLAKNFLNTALGISEAERAFSSDRAWGTVAQGQKIATTGLTGYRDTERPGGDGAHLHLHFGTSLVFFGTAREHVADGSGDSSWPLYFSALGNSKIVNTSVPVRGDNDSTTFGGSEADTISASETPELIAGGGGGNTFIGTLEQLDSDQIVDTTSDDAVRIQGETLALGDIGVRRGSIILDIDGDGDGIADASLTLTGNVKGRLLVAPLESDTLLMFDDENGSRVLGTDDPDILLGNSDGNVFEPGGGADRMLGNGGADIFTGTALGSGPIKFFERRDWV